MTEASYQLGIRQPLYGLLVNAMTMEQVLEEAAQHAADRSRFLIGVVNAAKIVKLRKDALLRESLLVPDVVLADGQAVVWASRLLGHPLPERVAGIDLFERLLALADDERRSVYFLGARQEVLEAMVERVRSRYPKLVIAGYRDGYFPSDESAAVAAAIEATGADMLFLGMTTPKKEIFLAEHGESLGVPIQHGVGGSFDILAGITKRAPERWQRMGLEWAYRLLQEPRRLFARYASTNAAFIALTVRERFRPTAPYRLTGASAEQED
ncbi:WecB/TagA/CpsF family glycosyltransferase [Cryobacterium sp. BB307]|uniref:WecB/TagA/CpsF family glycosyltransferase n=1 Tax=Cryobacterium sp. BB307 TaxID=2716317 RepID=UPI001B2FFE6C|nr:WecB/TagA/CpsF family glycosyltransferase [Cryobacterium sp. BB307]